jgi:hypothetical protein
MALRVYRVLLETRVQLVPAYRVLLAQMVARDLQVYRELMGHQYRAYRDYRELLGRQFRVPLGLRELLEQQHRAVLDHKERLALMDHRESRVVRGLVAQTAVKEQRDRRVLLEQVFRAQ